MEYYKNINSEEEMLQFAGRLAPLIPLGSVIFLHGDLGAGKTTFTRGFLRGLGYSDKVKSPTYTLVEPYELTDKSIYHFDLYRLNVAEELLHMGVQDYFGPSSICLLEWPEKGFPLLPLPDLDCYIRFTEQGRHLKLVASSQVGKTILQQL
ncbi:MAG: tRNA (adenosine(37)-N6)-threonylcarbamoyltransferase complex ATPase subunit type 1 TsaE, partial [Gammaproteobacteria bacterium]